MHPSHFVFSHYFINKGFFREDGQLLNDAHKIKHIPTTIVQGRYDVVCPATTAWELKKVGRVISVEISYEMKLSNYMYRFVPQRLPDADFVIVADSGHSTLEPSIAKELVKATEKYKDL